MLCILLCDHFGKHSYCLQSLTKLIKEFIQIQNLYHSIPYHLIIHTSNLLSLTSIQQNNKIKRFGIITLLITIYSIEIWCNTDRVTVIVQGTCSDLSELDYYIYRIGITISLKESPNIWNNLKSGFI